MFDKGFKSDIVLGDEYEDTLTRIRGTAIAVSFFIHACERVVLTWTKNGDIKEASFDAPGLRHVKTDTVPTVGKTGGPGQTAARASTPSRR